MDGNEYIKIHIKNIPQDIIDTYNLQNIVTPDGYVYIKIKKGMYRLKQAAVLAYNNLVNNLREHGYAPIPQTVGLWKHKTLPTTFCLCFDNFGIKYFKKEHADHLLNALKTKYKILVDWNGTNYCGLTLK